MENTLVEDQRQFKDEGESYLSTHEEDSGMFREINIPYFLNMEGGSNFVTLSRTLLIHS